MDIEKEKERDKKWKLMVIDIFKRHKLAEPREIKILTDLIR